MNRSRALVRRAVSVGYGIGLALGGGTMPPEWFDHLSDFGDEATINLAKAEMEMRENRSADR